MSDARIRGLEAAAQRGEPGAAEALDRARERLEPPPVCARCNGSRLVVDPRKIDGLERGDYSEWDHKVIALAFSSGLWAVPCPACR